MLHSDVGLVDKGGSVERFSLSETREKRLAFVLICVELGGRILGLSAPSIFCAALSD
jgi:hypothetical protein